MTNEPSNDTNNFDIQHCLEDFQKLQIKPVYNKDYFLPALACFIELFGSSPSVRTMVRSAEKQLHVQSGISDSSLDNFSRQGVGKKTAEKFFRFFKNSNPKAFNCLESLCHTKDTIEENDNYWPWLGTVSSLQALDEKEESELALCVAFLAGRCHLSKQLKDTCRAKGAVEKDRLKMVPFYFSEANKHTLLYDEEIAALSKGIVIELKKDGRDVPRNAIVSMLRYRLDFYFNLMATLEVGILRFWLEIDADTPSRIPAIYQNGFFCSITDIQNQSSPFNRFLDTLKERFNPSVINREPPLSDYKLAYHIPINKKDEQYVTRHEAQKRQLRKWREGSTYPSFEALEKLVSDLFGYKDQVPIVAKGLATVGLVCIAMDRLNKQLLENNDIDSELLSEAYGSYSRYWQHYREQIWKKS